MLRRGFVAAFLLLQLLASVLSFSLAPTQLERAGIGTRFVQRGCSSPLQLQVAALRARRREQRFIACLLGADNEPLFSSALK